MPRADHHAADERVARISRGCQRYSNDHRSDGVPTDSVSIMEITDGLVTHETQYFADPFPAAPRRAALAEPIPAHDQQAG
jgi:hypothetical protein